MSATKPLHLVLLALFVTAASWILTWRFYGEMAGIGKLLPITLLLLAVFLVLLGRYVRAAIADNRIGQDRTQVHPITVVRIAALGTAAAWFGAMGAGTWGGMLIYVLTHYSQLTAAREDTPGAILGVVASVVLASAGLWVERCCSVPPPKDGDREDRYGSPAHGPTPSGV